MENIDPNLLNEVIVYIKEYYYIPESESINKESKLEEDIGITGDEAWEFFNAFSKKYNVDISNFLMYDYFKAEGSDFLEFFGLKKKKVKKFLTVSNLVQGIKAGILNEEVINLF